MIRVESFWEYSILADLHTFIMNSRSAGPSFDGIWKRKTLVGIWSCQLFMTLLAVGLGGGLINANEQDDSRGDDGISNAFFIMYVFSGHLLRYASKLNVGKYYMPYALRRSIVYCFHRHSGLAISKAQLISTLLLNLVLDLDSSVAGRRYPCCDFTALQLWDI